MRRVVWFLFLLLILLLFCCYFSAIFLPFFCYFSAGFVPVFLPGRLWLDGWMDRGHGHVSWAVFGMLLPLQRAFSHWISVTGAGWARGL
ncbi:hypothetical protein K504DRAFT_468170 [Pleomassaria siparia CBS 279.74]|uniref:Uncharacterized protein n=1 Tax=Pleomassaria siparia CBS 279.74 TaxID=1314801 RepID=A0A6G1K7T4_9PLEO|nr:hypothetical protein K504DRAFT_468170 [Pleomassaria siparia CBS 279.74]